MNESEKEIEKIVLHYADGSTKEIKKGFIADVCESKTEGNSTITFEMVGTTGKDLVCIIQAVLQLGDRMGMFGDKTYDD